MIRRLPAGVPEPHEAYLPTQPPPASPHARFSRPHAHEERPHGAEAPPRQRAKAPHGLVLGPGVVRTVSAAFASASSWGVHRGADEQPTGCGTICDAAGPPQHLRSRSAGHHRVASVGRRGCAQSCEASAARAVPAPAGRGGRPEDAARHRCHSSSRGERRGVCRARDRFSSCPAQVARRSVGADDVVRAPWTDARAWVSASAQSVFRRGVPVSSDVLGVCDGGPDDPRPCARIVARPETRVALSSLRPARVRSRAAPSRLGRRSARSSWKSASSLLSYCRL